jgi:hypothetical protein
LRKLFIGHFGDKEKEDWFFSWADSEKEAIKTIERVFGEPVFIEEVSNVSSGGFCFKPINVSDDENPYYLLEPFQDDFKFENDEYIQKIISKEKIETNNNELSRDEYRKLIETENINQKKLEENEYTKIIEKIDKINQ